MNRIRHELVSINPSKVRLVALREAAEDEDAIVADRLQNSEDKLTLANAEKAITAIDKFHDKITKHWSTTNQRGDRLRRARAPRFPSVPAPSNSWRIGP
jgi:hypothetical protein